MDGRLVLIGVVVLVALVVLLLVRHRDVPTTTEAAEGYYPTHATYESDSTDPNGLRAVDPRHRDSHPTLDDDDWVDDPDALHVAAAVTFLTADEEPAYNPVISIPDPAYVSPTRVDPTPSLPNYPAGGWDRAPETTPDRVAPQGQ